MGNQSIYTQIIESRSGCKLPCFASGRTVDSRYDPNRDSLRICQAIKPETKFVIVTGIAGGFLIQAILQNRPDIFILAVEKSDKELEFLQQMEIVKELSRNEGVCFCTLETLKEKILELYVPSFYGNLEVVEQRGWTEENKELLPELQAQIQNTLGIISADFSVQSHFGKLWQHNIMSNLKLLSKATRPADIKNELNKTAVILGAGPTLEQKIPELKNKRGEYYIIATDTAFSILCNNDLSPDCIVSLDGQNASARHFIHSKPADLRNTIFLFDLTANPAAVRKALLQKCKIIFFVSGHPLSTYINKRYQTGLLELFSGAGTVTISALDYAVKCGFSRILIYGADFAYVKGKSYARGTYLDSLYNTQSSRLIPLEKQFDRLLYRTPLIKLNPGFFTTSVLEAYRISLEKYLEEKNIGFTRQDDSYILQNSCVQKPAEINKKEVTDSDLFITELTETLLKSAQSPDIPYILKKLSPEQICLLPLISWLRFYDNKKEAEFSFYLNKAAAFLKKYLGRN